MALQQLSDNEEILIDKYTVRKTDKFYEIENGDLHECFCEKKGVLPISKQFDPDQLKKLWRQP